MISEENLEEVRHLLSEIYSVSFFDWDTMPEDMKKEAVKSVVELSDRALKLI